MSRVVVWGRNCAACLECEERLRRAGVKFERRDLNFVLVGTWVGKNLPEQPRLMAVAAAYLRSHRMPILEIDGKFEPYPDAMDRVGG